MIRDMIASFECDGCGAKFSVKLDHAHVPPHDLSLFEIAEEALNRGELGSYRDKRDGICGTACQAGHFCNLCSARTKR